MRTLEKDSFEKAKLWINVNGRFLEKARFSAIFDGVHPGETLSALKVFQNEDGGFGHAMEPDLRTPDSSVLGTSIAFQILRSFPVVQYAHDITLPAIKFLLSNYDSKQMSWRIIPQSAENSPHAPWWNQAGREEYFSGFHLNPSAEILGYLYDFMEQIPNEIISSLSVKIIEELNNLKEIEMHDFLCCKRLSESSNLSDSFKQNLLTQLGRLLDSCVVRDPREWSGYGLRPLQVVDSPNSTFYNKLRNSIEENLDYEIDTQDASGGWFPTWTWRDTFPKEWEKVKNEWAGIITLEKLIILKRFRRIES